MSEDSGVDDLVAELGIGLPDYFAHRDMSDGRHLCVTPLTFGRARLIVSLDDTHNFVESGY